MAINGRVTRHPANASESTPPCAPRLADHALRVPPTPCQSRRPGRTLCPLIPLSSGPLFCTRATLSLLVLPTPCPAPPRSHALGRRSPIRPSRCAVGRLATHCPGHRPNLARTALIQLPLHLWLPAPLRQLQRRPWTLRCTTATYQHSVPPGRTNVACQRCILHRAPQIKFFF